MSDKASKPTDKVSENSASSFSEALGSFLTEANKVAQKTLDPRAQDMVANKALEDKGALPQSRNVANLDQATPSDRNAPIQAMMASDDGKLSQSLDRALANT